ncbi:MAG: pyridoxal-phosphate dependent enzyme, partial [Candidatus Altiarchaeales archaeon]|nr:pyridoxal-phosphate dependent enzyme [Candidatus Altiarchaeales archaeon]
METKLRCIDCGRDFKPTAIYRCDRCGGLLDVVPELSSIRDIISKDTFNLRLGSVKYPYMSGVWRFRELINPLIRDEDIISRPEGNTNIYRHKKISRYSGIRDILLKHEGENPTGSFKDRGMTSGLSEAKRLGM